MPPTLMAAAGFARTDCFWPRFRNSTRSDSAKRRSRRRPTRRQESRPRSLQRRIEACLTLRNRAASAVLNSSWFTGTFRPNSDLSAHVAPPAPESDSSLQRDHLPQQARLVERGLEPARLHSSQNQSRLVHEESY